MRREEATTKDEEAHCRKKKKPAATMGLWVYVGIENCTFDLEFCSLFGWLEFGGKEKKKAYEEEKERKLRKERLRAAMVIKEKKEKKLFKYFSSA